MNIGSKNYQKGFTLLEMLLVIAMIAILVGIVIVAINPGRQLAQARNAQRASDLRAIHSAVNQYYIDNSAWPAGLSQTEIDGTMLDICKMGITDPACLSLEAALVPTYISTIPVDPQNVASSDSLINTAHAQATNLTGYRIGINPTSQTPNLYAVNSNEYDLEEVQIMAACGDPTNGGCWATAISTNPATGVGFVWSNETVATGINSATNGKTNTDALYALGPEYEAATYCAELTEGGYPTGTWYLPAIDQLEDGIEAQVVAGSLSGFSELSLYWSSTESSTDPWGAAWDAVYWSSSINPVDPVTSMKGATDHVRCLR